jgi:hypothetical protein
MHLNAVVPVSAFDWVRTARLFATPSLVVRLYGAGLEASLKFATRPASTASAAA